MGEIKWIKIYTNMINNKKVKRIRKMPSGNDIILIWVFLIAQAGECNQGGSLFLSEAIPFSPEDLAIEFDFPLDVIKLALITLERFGMIEMFDAVICIKNWEEYQNVEGMERIREQTNNRVKKHRERKKQALLSIAGPETACNVSGNVTVTHGNATEEEREEEIDIEYSSSSTENDIGKIIDLLKDGQFKLPIEKYLNKWISEWLVDFDITTIEGFIEEAIIHNKTDSLAYIKTIIKTRNKPSSRNGSTVKKPCPENKDTEKPKSNKYEKFYL